MPASKKTIIQPNTTFGKLTVMRLIGSNQHSKRVYECHCECGNDLKVVSSNLKTGRTTSCPKCGHERGGKGREHPLGAGFTALMSVYRYNAKKRKLEFRLTEEDVAHITKLPCAYCGSQPSARSRRSISNEKAYIYNGIDRVDSKQGYSLDNVNPCCWTCGRAKRCLSLEQFKELIILVCNHHALDQS
jgi:DNA-directed RNA polymerase subunit RPC12/RpoP